MSLVNTQLNKRQDNILEFIEKQKQASVSQILEFIQKDPPKISKPTINRDLILLLKLNLIDKEGKGRSVVYELSPHYNLIKPIDVEEYFKTEVDKRQIKAMFDFGIFVDFKNILAEEEKKYLDGLTKKYKKNIKTLTDNLVRKEFERLTIELSWKSSQIEGNTYSLLETEQLIKNRIEAKMRTKDEAIMILNHKRALDFIRKNPAMFKKITIAKIEQVHYLLVQELKVKRNLRDKIVRITGTKYKPIDNKHQIKEAMDKMCKLINQEKNPFTKALAAIVLISYIQPFEDGNKRVARLISNAVLLSFGLCPLSFRSIDAVEYKKAIILFYEQNNVDYLKKLFIEQYKFAVENYFGAV